MLGKRPFLVLLCPIVVLAACVSGAASQRSKQTSTFSRSGVSSQGSLSTPKLSGLPFPAPAVAALPAAEAHQLSAAVAAVVDPEDSAKLPGVTTAVVTSSGSWSAASGRDGTGALLVPTDEMGIGSISKTFTAAEILTLASRGTINLGAPLSRYVHNRLLARNPTVRQTLAMLSGISDGTGTSFYQNPLNTSDHPDSHVGLTSALALDTAALSSPGGQDQRYSDAGYSLLALAIEDVTKHSLASEIRTDLLKPAGIDRVAIQDGDRPSAPMAYPVDSTEAKPLQGGYLPDRAVASGTLGCGSVAADAPSIARWGYELYGARLLPPATIEQMATRQTTDGIGNGTGYGLGTVIYPRSFGPQLLIGHDGLIARVDSDNELAGYQTLLIVDPARRFSLSLFAPTTNDATVLYQLGARLVTVLSAS